MDTAQFKLTLTTACGLFLTDRVVAGVSGGPDSLCMLDLLHQAGIDTVAVHVNHHLRAGADVEATRVAEFCDNHQIKYVIGDVWVTDYATEHHLSIEEAARNLRYEFLFAQAAKLNAKAVLVAHNSDDQVETVVMHILRGTGLSGLRGMQVRTVNHQWSQTIPLIRPLLSTSREEIEQYCNDRELKPSRDPSNEDTTYFRNRIRASLIPDLMTYNPQVKERFLKMSEIVKRENDYIEQAAAGLWDNAKLGQSKEFVLFSRSALMQAHPALLNRLLKRTMSYFAPNLRDIEFDVIDRANQFITRPGRISHLELCGSIEIIRYRNDQIILCQEDSKLDEFWPRIEKTDRLALAIPGTTTLNAKWVLTAKLDIVQSEVFSGGMACQVDAGKIETLEVATVERGERFTPFGLQGKTIKVGDFWTNEGLPLRARSHWPIVRSQGEIVWIPGFRISEKYKVDPTTQKVLSLEVRLKDA